MEALQNTRAQRWGNQMDKYAFEREQLAQQLTSCFENLEQETGIFLIKPVYSLKGRWENKYRQLNYRKNCNESFNKWMISDVLIL